LNSLLSCLIFSLAFSFLFIGSFSESVFAIEATIIEGSETISQYDAQLTEIVSYETTQSTNEQTIIPIIEILNVPKANNPSALLFLIPVLGFVLVKTFEADPNSKSFKRVASMSLLFTLVVWTFSVPSIVGTAYWGQQQAFAEESFSDIPLPFEYFEFDSIPEKYILRGNPEFVDSTNPSLLLNGDSFLRQKSFSTKNFEQLTISAWVKPDYNKGSPQFTVVSKEKSFSLAINKLYTPEKIATFSVYDGIKWHKIESKSIITEDWTHLAATFSDSSINLYVNGVLESSLNEIGAPFVVSLSSESDTVVGAYRSDKNGDISIQNKFAGNLDSVYVYDDYLNPSSIQQLYDQNRVSIAPKPIAKEPIDIVTEIVKVIEAIPNQFGFVPDGKEHHAQLTDEQFSEGFAVPKPEDKKKKPSSTEQTTTGGIARSV